MLMKPAATSEIPPHRTHRGEEKKATILPANLREKLTEESSESEDARRSSPGVEEFMSLSDKLKC